MKRILVATDGSEDAGRAVRFAADLAGREGADLLILNVIGGFGLPGGVFKGLRETESGWFDELLTSNSAKILRDARQLTEASNCNPPILASRHGHSAPTIMEYAHEQAVDAIVVGKRGEGQVQGVLLGSVSQKLVSMADLVAIVVP